MTFKRGDTVHHRPTGEDWILRDADETHVWPAGWPDSRALAEDCELIEKGGGLAFLENCARMRQRSGYRGPLL